MVEGSSKHDRPDGSGSALGQVDRTWYATAAVLTAVFAIAELVCGIAASSLTLTTDAGLMLIDSLTYALNASARLNACIYRCKLATHAVVATLHHSRPGRTTVLLGRCLLPLALALLQSSLRALFFSSRAHFSWRGPPSLRPRSGGGT